MNKNIAGEKLKKNKFKIAFLLINLFTITILLIVIQQYILWNDFETSRDSIDQYSLGHFFLGMIICIIVLITLTKLMKKQNFSIIILALIISLIIAILWEIFENSPLIVNSGLKFNYTRDSQINSGMDIFLSMIGSLLVCIPYWYSVIKKKKKSVKKTKYYK